MRRPTARRARRAVPGLLLTLLSFAVTLYAGARLLDGDTVGVLVWFAGAALLHDLVLLPLYACADRALRRLWSVRGAERSGAGAGAAAAAGPGTGTPWINYVRVPVFVCGVLLLVWFPLILGRAERYEGYTTLPAGVFRERWLLLTAAAFAVSAVLFAVRLLRARWRGWGGPAIRDTGRGPDRPARPPA